MKKLLKILIPCLLIPVVIIIGVITGDKNYAAVSVIVAVLACVPFFLSFESTFTGRKIVILAVMTALSVAGRFIFAPIPFFKPVTAMVIIAAMYFGAEFGFLTGALSAVLSNFYFGQGPWTPFQMFAWGFIGFIAGVLADPLRRSKIALVLYAIGSGFVYSLIMDTWTSMWADGSFVLSRFLAATYVSLPVTAVYIASNIIFLLVLTPLIGTKIERLITKYGL